MDIQDQLRGLLDTQQQQFEIDDGLTALLETFMRGPNERRLVKLALRVLDADSQARLGDILQAVSRISPRVSMAQ